MCARLFTSTAIISTLIYVYLFSTHCWCWFELLNNFNLFSSHNDSIFHWNQYLQFNFINLRDGLCVCVYLTQIVYLRLEFVRVILEMTLIKMSILNGADINKYECSILDAFIMVFKCLNHFIWNPFIYFGILYINRICCAYVCVCVCISIVW